MLVDLSHAIRDGLVTYKGLPPVRICDYLTREASRALYTDGTEFQIGRIDMVANTGTYIDVPFHRFPDGADLAATPLDRFCDLPAIVIRDERELADHDVAGKAVLFHTGWSAHWDTPRYFTDHPFVTAATATLLRDRGARLVGIDSHNIDDTRAANSRPVHTTLLAAGIPIVEHLTNLAALSEVGETGFTFSAIPPKIVGMGTFAVRAFARTLDR